MPDLINIRDFVQLQRLQSEEYTHELISLNEQTSEYGLTLGEREAAELVETRAGALRDNGRVEMGLGALSMIIKVFSVSEYITQENYAETLNDLLELFYFLKTETHDKVSDRELIETMFDQFENNYHGSVDLMQSREFKYQKNADELPYEYSIGDGDDDGKDPSPEDSEYLWDKDKSNADDDDYYMWDKEDGE